MEEETKVKGGMMIKGSEKEGNKEKGRDRNTSEETKGKEEGDKQRKRR